jgi:hypothetical protein
VDFDGSNDYLSLPDNADWDLGTTFTIEAWVKLDVLNNYNVIIAQAVGGNDWYMSVNSDGSCQFYDFNGSEQIDSAAGAVSLKTWSHVAFVANGGTGQWYINGNKSGSSGSINVQGGSNGVSIGSQGTQYKVNGRISNLRLVKGTAVYTASFRPPTEPLTNITNTKLLCCNNSSTTGSTVSPGTITATGSPTASTDSPFDDPAGFVFGDSQEGVIKCGSYVGNASTSHRKIELGFEPQWVMVKNTNTTGWWTMSDTMRKLDSNGGTSSVLYANSNIAEGNSGDLTCHSTGFGMQGNSSSSLNGDGNTMVYIAVRRPDGYVGKPPELGTGVFAMDTGAGSSTIPNFDANFPVDFTFLRTPASSSDWFTGARLIGNQTLKTNSTAAESAATAAYWRFDDNKGWNAYNGYDSTYQSWMWKRHAGFDVVTWEGDDTNAFRSHSLGKTPEMIWFKNRDDTRSWRVFHKGLNGGTNPEDYAVSLNASSAEGSNTSYMNGTAPTSTHFVAGLDGDTNVTGDSYIAMLFASVNGISKVGSFVGSDSDQTITLGFQPRFLIVKAYNQAYSWLVLDSTRGWATSSGNNSKYLFLELDWAQDDIDVGYLTSTGFVAKGGSGNINDAGASYIYYAHA